ncbi:MAG TPA: two-component regulator propeller domain-containing protein [Pyrinomonadaceae bacterium]|nr:two-component regulator propeller domain-containing protein [Pyrinomonadaceae bacterium]
MVFSRSYLGWLFLVCTSVPTAAQYRFDHWTSDNGLPQNSVRDILKTRDGYLWLTTFDGLVRFDGVHFTVFNKANSPGIASNRFVKLFEDSQGDLWALLDTGETVRRHEGRFTTYSTNLELPNGVMPLLSDDGHGNVIIYYLQINLDNRLRDSTGATLRGIRWANDRFQPADLNVTYSMPPLSVNEIGSLSTPKFIDGDYWVATDRRVLRLRKGGTYDVYDEKTGLPGTEPKLIWANHLTLKVITRDATGRIWLTELQSGQSQLLSQSTPEGFKVQQPYADDEGNYWFSTYDNGLFRARPQVVTSFGKAQGLGFSEIYPLLETRDGALWIGAYREGLFRLKDGVFTQYPAVKNESFSSFDGFVFSLYEDRAGQLWVSGRWSFADGRFIPAPWADALRYPTLFFIATMCEDQAGAYWLGADVGVFRYLNGTITAYTTKDGLAGNDTRVIIEDGQGGLWLGSYGGLTHYKDARFTAWTEKDGLPSNAIRALKLDRDGTLWIGTYDGGLGRFKDGKFTRYGTKDGLFDNGVFQILEDDFGWFWMNSNRGIYRVRKQELEDFAAGRIKAVSSLAYNRTDGMPSTEGNGGLWPAGVKTRDGKLWFPTMGGLAMIDPSTVKANTKMPPVVIEEMRINNQPAPFDAWYAALRDPNSAIQVRPGQDNFEIAYTALSFINSENMRFKYKLEGADHDWVDAGTRRTAYFSHLAPGSYTFRVIAANADGVWNEVGASVRIRIVPPFWRTWWFATILGLGVVAILIGAVVYRDTQLKRRQATQQATQQAFARQLIESQEQERKRIAAELHDSLGQNLLIVKNRAQLGQLAAQGVPEFLEEFDWIVNSASQSIEEVRQIAQNLRPYHLDRLGLTKALEVMIEKVAATTRIRFVSELVPLDYLFDKDDAITLYRVFQESLNNIIKHANASEVHIGIERLTESITLTIHDNGRGFSPVDAVAKLSGFGLVGIAERVRMLQGEWQINSKPGQGTTVTIRLPITTKDKHNGR